MEMSMNWWQLIIAAITALGGLEFFKWFFNRKTDARVSEFHLLKETNEFLQQQLREKEQRFAEQTQLLRSTQRDLLDAAKREAEKDIAHAQEVAELRIELAEVRCEDGNCPFRLPPNAKTPPRAGMTKEQYQQQKQQKQ